MKSLMKGLVEFCHDMHYEIAIGANIGFAVANLIDRNVDGVIGFALAALWAWRAMREHRFAKTVMNATNELLKVIDEIKDREGTSK